MGSTSERDTVVAVIGASAAFSGLVLVFLGLLLTGYQTLLGQTTDRILGRFRIAAWLSLGAFFLAVLSVVLGVVWLDADGGHAFYVLVLVAFFVELAALAGVAVFATWRVLLRS